MTFFCDICEQMITARVGIRKIHSHKFLVHDKRSCDVCGKCFEDITKFNKHVYETCQRKKRFRCEICGRELANKIRLREHIKSKHTEKNEHCDICDQMVVSLTEHKEEKHSSLNLKQCHLCGFTGRAPLLWNHVRRMHKEFVKVSCPNCGKQVRNLGLRHHVKNTQCDRPVEERAKFKCNMCEKTFVSKKGLRDHVLYIHNQENPYKCEQCEYQTYNKSNLRMHVKRVHEKRPLYDTCPHCDKQVVNLDYHTKIYHRDLL